MLGTRSPAASSEKTANTHGSRDAAGMTTGWNVRLLLDELEHRGGAPALMAVQKGMLQTLSGGDLAKRAHALAYGFLKTGIEPNEPVALIGPNGFEWVVIRLALELAGALTVAIDEFATDDEIRAILAQCKAGFVICNGRYAEALRKFDGALRIIAFGARNLPDGAYRLESLFDTGVRALPGRPAASPAMLAFTSGTTGMPKAIVLTGANVAANVEALVKSRLVGPADRVLLLLPLHHVYPFVVGLLAALGSGATVVFPESVTGPDILAATKLASVSAIVGVPRLYSAICSGLIARTAAAGTVRRTLFHLMLRLSIGLNRALGVNAGRILFRRLRKRFGERLRLLVSGGARLEPETLGMLTGLGFEVRVGYGLAETASMFTANLQVPMRWGSQGRPVAGSMRISAPDESGIGEIELKGPQIFSRYLDNPEATRAAFTADGWFRTGDIGYIDSDGFLYVTGRVKETLVLGGGKKINPEALEQIYGASRYIREIAIFEHGGCLAALVVPSLDATRAGGAMHIDTAIRVELASLARTLPSYQRLAGFAITREPLPRTRLGKYRRFLLPQIYENAQRPSPPGQAAALSAEDETLLNRPIARQVFEILRQRYPDKQLTLDASPLLDLGIDSLEWISFGLELEDRLNLRLSEADIGSVVTVRDLLATAVNANTLPSPFPADAHDWIAPTGPALNLFGAIFYALNQIAMRTLFRFRVQGARHLRADGNFILIANHSSYLDPLALAAAVDFRVLRRCYWAGDPAILFSKRWKWPFMRAMHCYPVNEREPAHALEVSAAILRRGDSIVWFPEGWRSPDGKLQPFLPGIGHLLEEVPTPVVPAFIDGTFEALPRDRSFPKLHSIRVRIGEPIPPARWQSLKVAKKEMPQEIAQILRGAVDALGQETAR